MAEALRHAREPLLPTASSPAQSSPRVREPLLDNARAALIAFVVMYHSAVVYTSADRPEAPIAYASGLLALCKPIAMPCFCLISGHLSRPQLSLARALSLARLFTAFLIFQALYHFNNLLGYRLNGFDFKALPVQLFVPRQQVVTWFLFALCVWRALLPLVARLRAPIATSLLLGHAALFVDLGPNYQNVLSFLPYFVIGSRLPPSVWPALSRPLPRAIGAASFVLVASAVVGFSAVGGARFADAFDRLTTTYQCFNGYAPAPPAIECASGSELLQRALFYAVSLPLLAGFLCLLPRASGAWSVPGYMSMYVYLLHPLVITNPLVMHFAFQALSRAYGREVNVWSPATQPSAVAASSLFALIVCVLLSTPAARCAFSWLVEPPISLLCAPLDSAAPPAAPPAACTPGAPGGFECARPLPMAPQTSRERSDAPGCEAGGGATSGEAPRPRLDFPPPPARAPSPRRAKLDDVPTVSPGSAAELPPPPPQATPRVGAHYVFTPPEVQRGAARAPQTNPPKAKKPATPPRGIPS